MALRSSHCRIPVGLASMDRPLLVSSVESQLWGFCSWLYRASWLARVHSPASPIALLLVFCSGVPSGSLLQVSRQVFAMGLPFRVESLSPRSERSLFLHLPGVWLESSRWGHPVGSGLSQISIGTKTFLRTFPSGWCLAFAMGSPMSGRVALFCALDRNEGFSVHLSLVAS